VTKGTINLLPKEEKKRDVKSIVLNIFMVLVILLFISIILLSVFIFEIDNMLTLRLSDYESVNAKIQDQVNKLKVYDDFSNKVSNKKELMQDLKKNELIWSKVIYDIGRLMPEGAYIKTFDARGSQLYSYLEKYGEGEAVEGKKIIAFSITGDASEYTDILKLVIELKKIENVKTVWIQSMVDSTVTENNIEVINFTINTFWEIEPFIEDIEQADTARDEDDLESEMEEINS
jgi:hypothetical protein